jgi:carbonic anhydrase/acetyltransferase-like protein (isoleucine patch superfamily)
MEQVKRPVLGKSVYIANTSFVAGDVHIGDNSTIMHHVMIRGDIAPIRIGARVNIQDGSVVHIQRGVPLDIADGVGVGHRAVVHCRRVGSRTLIATGAIVLDGCEIGERCIIAAGTVLTPGTKIPDDSVVMGIPGKVVRQSTKADLAVIDHVVNSYVELGRQHAAGLFPNIVGSTAK